MASIQRLVDESISLGIPLAINPPEPNSHEFFHATNRCVNVLDEIEMLDWLSIGLPPSILLPLPDVLA